jgi:hypothetical protein
VGAIAASGEDATDREADDNPTGADELLDRIEAVFDLTPDSL